MFGGLIASAIANMQGIRNYSSWRWVFILEGIATIILGVNAYFFVADFPADVHWLTPKEKDLIIARTEERSAAPITIHNIVLFFSDVKNIVAPFIYFGKYSI